MENTSDIQTLLAGVRALVESRAPHLLPLFETFAGEAAFGREWLQAHLASVPRGAELLEVGAGLTLLSCQLAREGFRVTALEPVGSGFSDFHELQALVREYARAQGIALAMLEIPVEALDAVARHDFAFSINVMEHVGNVARAIENVTRALRPGGRYAFTCPNYWFPYEPHFGIPTVGSKALTYRVFGSAIRGSRRVPDPEGLWQSLNWISVAQVHRSCASLPDVQCRFDRGFLGAALLRVTRDPLFSQRRSRWMRGLARVLVATGAHRLTSLVPAVLQPVINCTLVRLPS